MDTPNLDMPPYKLQKVEIDNSIMGKRRNSGDFTIGSSQNIKAIEIAKKEVLPPVPNDFCQDNFPPIFLGNSVKSMVSIS